MVLLGWYDSSTNGTGIAVNHEDLLVQKVDTPLKIAQTAAIMEVRPWRKFWFMMKHEVLAQLEFRSLTCGWERVLFADCPQCYWACEVPFLHNL